MLAFPFKWLWKHVKSGRITKRLLAFAALLALVFHVWVLGCLMWWSVFPVHRTMFMHIYTITDGSPPINHQWVSSDNISVNLKRALVTSEDARFMQHNGFDVPAMKRAWLSNSNKGKVVRGGSTISQQLAKNLFLFNKRSYFRKAEEVVITVMIEALWSKERILTVYLNSIEYGEGIYGAQAAAKHYYNVDAKSLTRRQAAKLAALVPNPKFYQKHPKHRKLTKRRAAIERYMKVAHIP